MTLQFDAQDFKNCYRDESTGDEIPTHLVHRAMCEEIAYFNDLVWELEDVQEARKAAGEAYKPIRTRWVICSKGDRERPEVHARLVACEMNTYKRDTFHASTPPS